MEGEGHSGTDGGLSVETIFHLLPLVLTNFDDYEVHLITNRKESIEQKNLLKNNITIFLEDEHFTVMVYIRDEVEINYFDSYGSIKNGTYERDFPQI